MSHQPRHQPLPKTDPELIVGEILAPKRGEINACFKQGAIEIKHANESGPSSGPVGDGEDRATM